MNSELKVLKEVWENNRETHTQLISNQTGFGLDYIRYLCNCLFKKDQLKPIKGKRDWYRITPKGEKQLRLAGIIKAEVPGKARKIEKVIYYLPAKKLKVSLPKGHFQKIRTESSKDNLIKPRERKLNLGKKIERVVSYLRAQR